MGASLRLGWGQLSTVWTGFVKDWPRVAGIASLVALLAASGVAIRDEVVFEQVTVVLAFVAVALGIGGAISMGVLGQLTDDPRGLWLCVAFTLYSVLGIPAAALGASYDQYANAAIGNVRFCAHVLFTLLIVMAVLAPDTWPPSDGWTVLYLGLGTATGVAALGMVWPAASLAVTTYQPGRYLVAAVLVVASVLLVLASWRRGSSPLFWTGMGCTVIAVAHVCRVGVGGPFEPLDLTFSIVRLFGVLLFLVGAVDPCRSALLDAYRTRTSQQRQLGQAERERRRVAERDHELRNGLAGLSSATRLLKAGGRDARLTAELCGAVAAEVARLEALLRRYGLRGEAIEYDVTAILGQQVELRASAGMDVRLDAEDDLRVVGDPAVLAQVVANLLANCAQHAEGSPVEVWAGSDGPVVSIGVRDRGPGIPPGFEQAAFEMCARGPGSTGHGLGLHICRELLAGESGDIRFGPTGGRAGCTVLVEVPAVSDAGSRTERRDVSRAGASR